LDVWVVMGWVREAGGATVLPAHGPGVVLKRKGTRSQGRVHLHTNSTLYYARARLLIGQTCSVHIRLAIKRIYSCVISHALCLPNIMSIDKTYIKPHCALICRSSEPSYTDVVPRIFRCQSSHLHRAVPFSVRYHARLYFRKAAAAASRTP